MRNLFFVFLLFFGCSGEIEPQTEPQIEPEIVEVVPDEEAEIVYNKFDDYSVNIYESGFELYYSANMIDGVMSTYANTSELQTGDYMEIQFDFYETANIEYIELYDYQTNDFNMGLVEIKYNGIDLPGYSTCGITTFTDNKVVILIDKENVNSITIKMSYSGSCAYGVQQSFYISEVELTEWKEF